MAILAICLLNLGISWWNTYISGSLWNESKKQGGFLRILVWCGAIQSALGFSSVIVIALLAGSSWFLMQDPQNAEEVRHLWEIGMSMWYLAIIVPALGSGLIITLHSWRETIKRRDFGSMATAGWNTYAQTSNMINAVGQSGQAWNVVGDGLGSALSGKGDAKEKAAILAFLVVICALMLGVILTAVLIKHYAAKAPVLGRVRRRASA